MGGAASIQSALEASVETWLDDDERFRGMVMDSFDEEADPVLQALPAEKLLLALTSVYDSTATVLPPAGRRLVTRPPEQSDIDAELAVAAASSMRAPALDFDAYAMLAHAVYRRIALDRGRRMLLGVASGVVGLFLVKATLRRTPLVGPLFQSLVLPLLPVGCGPALGIAALAFLPDATLGTASRRLQRRSRGKR